MKFSPMLKHNMSGDVLASANITICFYFWFMSCLLVSLYIGFLQYNHGVYPTLVESTVA